MTEPEWTTARLRDWSLRTGRFSSPQEESLPNTHVTVSVPEELRERMRNCPNKPNWSRLAVEAFEKFLDGSRDSPAILDGLPYRTAEGETRWRSDE